MAGPRAVFVDSQNVYVESISIRMLFLSRDLWRASFFALLFYLSYTSVRFLACGVQGNRFGAYVLYIYESVTMDGKFVRSAAQHPTQVQYNNTSIYSPTTICIVFYLRAGEVKPPFIPKLEFSPSKTLEVFSAGLMPKAAIWTKLFNSQLAIELEQRVYNISTYKSYNAFITQFRVQTVTK